MLFKTQCRKCFLLLWQKLVIKLNGWKNIHPSHRQLKMNKIRRSTDVKYFSVFIAIRQCDYDSDQSKL